MDSFDEPPAPPDEADCCNSGCNPCILDVYEEQLRKYRKRTAVEPKLKNCISQTSYTVFQLTQVVEHTKGTFLYTFQYVRPYKQQNAVDPSQLSLHFSPGQHFMLRGTLDKLEYFSRAYTPLPPDGRCRLSFTVLVRLYEDGRMSHFIGRLKVNGETLWRGPYGDFAPSYTYKHMLLIAQGTGIAPIYSVIDDVLKNDECCTFLKLYFCCRSCDDVLLRGELYALSSHWNFGYEVFVADAGSAGALYNERVNLRRLDGDDVGKYLEGKADGEVRVLICGSERFNEDVLDHVLKAGVSSSHIFVF